MPKLRADGGSTAQVVASTKMTCSGGSSAPWAHIKGVELTRLGQRVYRDELVARQDPRGRPYYWIGGQPPRGVPDHGTDIWALANNLISITPINLDLTAYRFMDELKRWKLEEL